MGKWPVVADKFWDHCSCSIFSLSGYNAFRWFGRGHLLEFTGWLDFSVGQKRNFSNYLFKTKCPTVYVTAVFEISGRPIVKTNLTLIRMTWIPRLVARLTTKYFLSVRAHVGGWILSYPLSILKVIFLESNPLQFIQTLISFIIAYRGMFIYARLK